MNEFSKDNPYGFKRDEDEEWIEVHSSAVTNTNPNSMVYVTINTTPICSNMSNTEFRRLIMRLRDTALILIRERIADVSRWDGAAKERATRWFGRADDVVRAKLATGLPKLANSMQELKPENIIRWDQQTNRGLTCAIVADTGTTDAAVCKPDSKKRFIAIYPHFCTLPDVYVPGNCKLKAVIHECTHYTDTFDSVDTLYGFGDALARWGQGAPNEAWCNADSIACYIAHYDYIEDFQKKNIW
ncbi:Lysine-specific metallo-endopeptidase domain-containing protein [Paraburkholderia sacchari]|uniref:M35 family metallo-endopeptidase n=1 Tax=Paraburkholderia sacchari TaxID=159450 RepID=UPI0039A6029B